MGLSLGVCVCEWGSKLEKGNYEQIPKKETERKGVKKETVARGVSAMPVLKKLLEAHGVCASEENKVPVKKFPLAPSVSSIAKLARAVS